MSRNVEIGYVVLDYTYKWRTKQRFSARNKNISTELDFAVIYEP